jgi:hypothetical protein
MQIALDAGSKALEEFAHFLGIGPRGQHSILSPPEFCPRYQFHRFRNLLGIFNTANSAPDIL